MATKGTVSGVIANMVTLVVDGPVAQNEICYISTGGDKLMAEVIKVVGSQVYVQVFESTRGLKVGAEAEFTGHMLEVTLGPGMLSKNYDGLQNDLDKMDGVFLKRGQYTYPLDKERVWHFVPLVNAGDKVQASAWLGQVDENFQPLKMMAPFTLQGTATVKTIMPEGDYKIEDTIAILTDEEGNDIPVTMIQRWPVKRAMTNYKEKPRPFKLLETGVRVIDTLNPIVEGGTGFIPGPFGTGKTVLQHAISKQAEADIVIIAACGERANEVVEIFTEFPELVDPHTGRKLMERTIIIANTSNMPVAAREASIYTGITIAEYFRDMGYSVALMADSTSRWAEALREMSGRLEEMPGEEGYPAYLGSRLAQFYERAGHVISLGKDGREGALSVIGAVSPPGGDTSEPVSQATLRIVKVFWGLDSALAYKRHFPAINWLNSYSLYLDDMEKWFNGNVAEDWMEGRQKMMTLLQEEAELEEIVKMVGMDALSPTDRLKMEAARSIREDFLHQNSFHEVDTYTSLKKQHMMMRLVNAFYERSVAALGEGASLRKLISMPVREQIGRFKYVKEDALDAEFVKVDEELSAQIANAFVKEDR